MKYLLAFGIFLISNNAFACQLVKASWYYEGKRTANGERFIPNGLTAAHRHWNFGTMVHVTNPHNKKSVIVRINDRGPFRKNRVIDLAAGAARAIGFNGVGSVCIEKM